ncbi:UDP-N-acetylmuramoyl-L-alanine--D-glutamate ligase [Candidatus Saccharibacteria bacterium]|nr:UDP-N-acetylmuramoyl-L-alanine--D-glutamate ligase [Candidatus Saccharibacteria bacterium]
MKIALLGYGKEGKASEKYFKEKFNASCDIFENMTPEEFAKKDYSSYDMILRSPSIPPLGLENESTITRYFFDHCPCKIIGVTATKGKGTTCSFIKSLLDAEEKTAYLVGNIGNPALEILDKLNSNSVVIYEMSSFQLWDLKKSPHIAIVGTIEPDHLNVHKDYNDYINAKANICRYQTENDFCIYFKNNPESVKIAENSKAQKIPYPFEIPEDIKNAITIPGEHNVVNCISALTSVACYLNISPDEYLREHKTEIIAGLKNFKGLPHRLEFLREINGVKYYDDNFSTNPASTRVAINSFPEDTIVLILGGRDKTNYDDLPEIYELLEQSKNLKNIILIGESGHELMKRYKDDRFVLEGSLEEAVKTAKKFAEENVSKNPKKKTIVLMSPSAASFDMFKNVYDRGEKFQNLVKAF